MIDDKFFKGMISDAVKSSLKRGFAFTGFLSEEEQAEAVHILKNERDISFSFFGGYPEADRRVLCIYRDEPPAWPIAMMEIAVRDKHAQIKHGDVLGSIMALSVERRVLGDIIIDGTNHAFVFLLHNMGQYFSQNLMRIGRYACDVTIRTEWGSLDVSRSFLPIECVISSNRLDCYVSELAKLSRSDSAELIKEGRVAVNGKVVTSPDSRLIISDKLTIRGKGKFIIESDPADSPTTQKGRLRIRIKKYN